MNIVQNRVVIYPKDVQQITGKSERYGRSLLRGIKKKLAKEKHQFVSIEEFCQHTGLKIEQVISFLTA
ncbi:hypothetical protein C3K47_11995 [Solitalea longa]|uniref:Uncharacterized protein n=1 Tax=Solitalea longa TaxID=2079460 RepID=A0A2S5A2E2_9SPHI|nr:hypothetical protein [Solitalea longa]POY36457.1 hypothetical protein C3K47_11995 [Solitalea longa]